jgi:5-oxoprolinase (ATP-hydrolysing) subunit C
MQQGLEILTAGPACSIQATARLHHRVFGVPPGGAADPVALALANGMAGNADPATPGLEICAPWEAVLHQDALLGICGAFQIEGYWLQQAHRVWAPAGTRLRVTGGGPWFSYLCVQGGWQAEYQLGSASTCLAGNFGGFKGRNLGKGDFLLLQIPVIATISVLHIPTITTRPDLFFPDAQPRILRVLPGPEWEMFTREQQQFFLHSSWSKSRMGNRMGVFLEPPLPMHPPLAEMVSTAVQPGVIQVPPSGRMMALLADAQTTGGYPRIAQVIKTDLPRLAQWPSGQEFRIQLVSLQEASWWYRLQQNALARFACGCRLLEPV